MNGYQVIGPLAYRGKKGCQSATCTHFFENGKISEDCFGWHCSYCDAPCGSQGHNCEAARTLLAESRRILDEQAARVSPGKENE